MTPEGILIAVVAFVAALAIGVAILKYEPKDDPLARIRSEIERENRRQLDSYRREAKPTFGGERERVVLR